MNCLRCDKGPSVFDIRHNFTANAVYELPFGTGKRFLNEGGVLERSLAAGASAVSAFGTPAIR